MRQYSGGYNLAPITNNSESAEDLAQDVFFRFYRIPPIRPAQAAWQLDSCARAHIIIDDYRRVSGPGRGPRSLDDHDYHLQGTSDNPSATRGSQRRLQVHRAIQKLTALPRACGFCATRSLS